MEADLGRPDGFFEEEGEELRLRVEKSIPFPSDQFRLGLGGKSFPVGIFADAPFVREQGQGGSPGTVGEDTLSGRRPLRCAVHIREGAF